MPDRKLCEVPGDGLKLSEPILEGQCPTMTTLRCLPLAWGYGFCRGFWRVFGATIDEQKPGLACSRATDL